MKLLLTILSITILTITAKAQLDKKNWLLGGSGSLYSYDENYNSQQGNLTGKYTNIDISASIGYFIDNKFVGGLRPFFTSEKGYSSGGGSANSYKIGIGPFVRYYFLKSDKQFNLLTDVCYQFGINKFTGTLKEKGKYNTLSIQGGTEIFFNSSVGLEFLVGYKFQSASIENSPSSYTNNKKGLQTSIGFQFHLQKK